MITVIRCWFLMIAATLQGNLLAQWERHTIDDSSRGADGVRLADINRDGWIDCVTGWEQGNKVRICVHPGTQHVRQPWPAVTVGTPPDVEDAVFVDLDHDGNLDVVSCSEGKTKSLSFHWAPRDGKQLLEASSWKTTALPAAQGRMMWMYALPTQLDHQYGIDIVAGGKGPNAAIGWFEAPRNARDLPAWTWHPLRAVGWLMTLETRDFDADGDLDILFSDRKLDRSGIYWLENPGPSNLMEAWPEHPVGALQAEAMFLRLCDLDQDGLEDIVAAIRPKSLLWIQRRDRTGKTWQSHTIPLPEEAGTAKAVGVGDINGDQVNDIVFSCENARAPQQGVMWLSANGPLTSGNWTSHSISGRTGVKFDLIELIDLDHDGDLDVLTTEEITNLGVVWYENPQRTP